MARFLGCLFVCVAALACHGQTSAIASTDIAPAPSMRFPSNWYPVDSEVTYTAAPQPHAPYAATLVTSMRYLDPATGKVKITSRSTLQARDSAGRRRDETESPLPDGHGGVTMVHEVSVSDPVSHCSFRWMEPWVAPGKPTSVVTCMPRTLHYNSQDLYADMLVSETKEVYSGDRVDRLEPLGKRVLGDLVAVGIRHTTTNSQSGQTLKSVTELWYSPELKELLEMKEIPDPTSAAAPSQTPDFELTQIERKEPDPALFYPPAEYVIAPGR